MSDRPQGGWAASWNIQPEDMAVKGILDQNDELQAQVTHLQTERDQLRMLWESVDAHLKGIRAHEASKGGQQAGTPKWLSLLKSPSVRSELEWLCREALTPERPAPVEPVALDPVTIEACAKAAMSGAHEDCRHVDCAGLRLAADRIRALAGPSVPR